MSRPAVISEGDANVAMPAELLPLSVVIPTRDRAAVLRRTFESLAAQSSQPARIILVDASENQATRCLCVERPVPGLSAEIIWLPAQTPGAACQRNQGVETCQHDVIGFFDDDILFELDCVARLWRALQSDPGLGGVNATITNQRYQPPGWATRLMFRLMTGKTEASYAGRVLGPAVNQLPEDRDDLPEIVPVQWLNTTCTLYRRAALPDPPFPSNFVDYSLMEDLALSLTIAKHWKLANARTARIYHDSQPGKHKDDIVALSRMELFNRHYVMTQVMGRCRVRDYATLALWESYQLAICALQKRGGIGFWQEVRGKFLGPRDVFGSRMKFGRR
jgi:glycosyltransferase involved in cell wall biosynthesis